MLFSDRPRAHYEKPLAHEVICQLRFPTILTINNTEPADFQEAVREDFPQYARRQDQLPPRVVNGKPEPQAPVTNYHFLSQDGRWKLNLTGFHRSLHVVLPRLGGVCPDAGQAPSNIHPAL